MSILDEAARALECREDREAARGEPKRLRADLAAALARLEEARETIRELESSPKEQSK